MVYGFVGLSLRAKGMKGQVAQVLIEVPGLGSFSPEAAGGHQEDSEHLGTHPWQLSGRRSQVPAMLPRPAGL